MALETSYTVQPFERRRPSLGRQKAAPRESGELEGPTILRRSGEVPDGFVDGLGGG